MASDSKLPVLSMGWIPFWNLAPMKYEITRTVRSGLRLNYGVPTQVNRWLADGEVDLAPCSSICLLRNPNFEMALPLGVSSDGPVKSVFIGYPKALEETAHAIMASTEYMSRAIHQLRLAHNDDARFVAKALWKARQDWTVCDYTAPTLQLTPQSATSSTLARMLYRLWFGDAAYEIHIRQQMGIAKPEGLASLELLIGDDALVKRKRFYGVIDLGEIWKKITGLPFVFAVWQSRSKCPLSPTWQRKFIAISELAQARMRIDPSIYYPALNLPEATIDELDLKGYWQVINYQLGQEELRGLLLFLYMAGYFMSDQMEESALVKIMRWQQLEISPT